MIKFLNFHKLALSLKEDISPSLMKTFGIFGLINFPLLYLLGASLLGEKVSALPYAILVYSHHILPPLFCNLYVYSK
jgi:hypothetical protein